MMSMASRPAIFGLLHKAALQGLSLDFRADRRGSISLIFGASMLPMVLFAGMAMDYAKATRTRGQLQAAADAAVLSTSRSGALTDSQRAQRATEFFRANLTANPLLAGVVPTVTATNLSVTLTAQTSISTSFMRIAGISEISVGVQSGVNFKGKRIELALMTDITGSMAEVRNGAPKIDGLKLAAADLLNIILPDNASADSARVALIPFANYVNAGSYAPDVTGLDPTKTQSNTILDLITCVTERTGTDAYTDAAPGPSAYVGGAAQGSSNDNYSADGHCNRNNSGAPLPQVMPLTNDKVALLSTVESFTPAGTTAGHLGTAWAWYALAPSWNAIWGLRL